MEFEIYNKSTLTSDLLAIYLFLLLRISTHGGAREGIILGNLHSQPNEDGGKQEVIVPVSRAGETRTQKSKKQKAKNKKQKNKPDENRTHEKLLIARCFSETEAIHF